MDWICKCNKRATFDGGKTLKPKVVSKASKRLFIFLYGLEPALPAGVEGLKYKKMDMG